MWMVPEGAALQHDARWRVASCRPVSAVRSVVLRAYSQVIDAVGRGGAARPTWVVPDGTARRCSRMLDACGKLPTGEPL